MHSCLTTFKRISWKNSRLTVYFLNGVAAAAAASAHAMALVSVSNPVTNPQYKHTL
jgi:hypothetical protein